MCKLSFAHMVQRPLKTAKDRTLLPSSPMASWGSVRPAWPWPGQQDEERGRGAAGPAEELDVSDERRPLLFC